jgi:hypothetical protein
VVFRVILRTRRLLKLIDPVDECLAFRKVFLCFSGHLPLHRRAAFNAGGEPVRGKSFSFD